MQSDAKKEKVKRKTSELYVDGKNSTEDREELQKELQRHCEVVFADPNETREVKERRIEFFKKKGDRHFTNDGRGADISVDLVLEASAKMSENKVNGPEDAVVSDDQAVAPGEDLYDYEMFSRTLHGQDGGTKFVEGCEKGFLAKTRCGTKEGYQKLESHSADISDVEMARILYKTSSGKKGI